MLSLKSRFRQTCLEKLAQTNSAAKLEAGIVVANAILPVIKSHLGLVSIHAQGVALFKNFADEIHTAPLCELLLRHGIKRFFPQVNSDYSMQFWDADTKLPVKTEEIAVLIVPGVAFDRLGNRLGRGKGYYDRFLADIPANQIFTIGIGLDSQVFDQIPVDEHDQCMNMIRTPSFEIIL